jgi:modification methylase fokI
MTQEKHNIISSPMNYIGGKAKLLPQLIPLFPTEINTLYDVFTGGGNIIANVSAKSYKANDLNDFVIGILDTFYRKDINNILSEIDAIINKYSLSKENADGFLRLRSDYNSNKSPLMLYTLICYSFNYQFRFNNNLDYNTPFGCNKSHFSDKLRERLISFIERLQMRDISFSSQHFDDFLLNQNFKAGDFVYLDPPYLITTGNYNDGNRGFKDWTNDEENRLYEVLEHLDKNGVKWALSNVIEHKGKKNQLLLDFSQHYNLHYLNYSYANSSHNTNRSSSKEILLTNY